MEAAKLVSPVGWNLAAKQPLRRPVASFPRSVRASQTLEANQKDGYTGPKPKRNWVADWVSGNDDVVRSLPIYVGGFSLFAVLFNRTLSGIAPVADAGRFWESLSGVTCCKSLVIVYDGECILQAGVAAKSSADDEAVDIDATKLIQGTLYQGILKSGAQRYFANLSLYPAKSELPFLPPNTQAVISQPLGNTGIAIIGGDTIRGFTTADQAWISLIGDKLDASLTKLVTKPASLTYNSG